MAERMPPQGTCFSSGVGLDDLQKSLPTLRFWVHTSFALVTEQGRAVQPQPGTMQLSRWKQTHGRASVAEESRDLSSSTSKHQCVSKANRDHVLWDKHAATGKEQTVLRPRPTELLHMNPMQEQ